MTEASDASDAPEVPTVPSMTDPPYRKDPNKEEG